MVADLGVDDHNYCIFTGRRSRLAHARHSWHGSIEYYAAIERAGCATIPTCIGNTRITQGNGYGTVRTPNYPRSLVDYQPARVLGYPALAINLTAAGGSIILLPLLGTLTWELHRLLMQPLDLPLTLVDALVMVLATAMTIVTHECIHAFVLRAHGYHVTCDIAWRQFAVYTAAFGQLQQRHHVLWNALAPLVLISVAMLPLLASADHYAVTIAFAALLTNTAGSTADLYLIWRRVRLPRPTLLLDVDPTQTAVFLPARA